MCLLMCVCRILIKITYLLTYSFRATAVLKMELKTGGFQYRKVTLAVRAQKHQLQFVLKVAAVCTDTRA